MIAYKYNPKTKAFIEKQVSNNCIALPQDLHTEIPCANCGKLCDFATMRASILIEDADKRAYSVCQDCYDKEQKALDRVD